MNAIGKMLNNGLTADEEQIRVFVDCIFRYADPGTLVGLRSFTHDKDDQAARIHTWPRIGGDNEALVAAATEAATESANNPLGLVFAPPVATFNANPGGKQQARLVDLANGLEICVELDQGDIGAFRRRLEGLLGPATVVVASGGVWIDRETGEIHDKLHLHWRLSEVTKTPEEHARLRLARNLAALLTGADMTAVPLVHPLRWPGSWHRKDKDAPKLCKIIASNPEGEVHLDEALKALQDAVELAGISLGAKSDGPHTPGKPQAAPARVASAVEVIPNADTTSWDDWNRMGLLIHAATGGGPEGLETWITWSRKSGKYVAGECQTRWEHFHTHAYTKAGAGTIFYMARAHGWTETRPRPSASESDGQDEPAAAEAGSHADILAEVEAEDLGGDDAPNSDAKSAGNVASLVLEKACRLSDLEFMAQRKTLAEDLKISPTELTVLRRARLAEMRAAEKAQDRAKAQTAKDAEARQKEKKRAKSEDAVADIKDVVARLNEQYLIVNEAGKALVYQRGEDAVLKRRVYHRLSTSDLKTLYMNDRVAIGVDAEGNSKMRSVASVWLNHADRRQFIHGVTFDPTNQFRPGVLNLWEGFGTLPVPGDWSLLKAHIRTVVCSGIQEHYDYLMNWLARLVQFPAQQGEVAVVLRGVEGCGKGTLASAVKAMIGHHALGINNAKHLVGNFNSHLRDVVFLFADEAFFAGDKQHIGVLKSLITESSLTIEGKYANAVEFPNFLHIMMASNEEWVVPADLRSRRFFVLNVPDTYVGNYAYFEKIRKQMDAGGYAAMLHELQNRDISHFNVRNIPNTEGLEQQRHLSLDTLHAWWLDCLERGYVFRSKLGLEEVFGVWDGEFCSTEMLFASYLEFAKARNERRPHNRVQLGKFMVEMGGKACRKRGGIVGEHIVDESVGDVGSGRVARLSRVVTADQPPGYAFGSLASARQAFDMTTNITIQWDLGLQDLPQEPDAAKQAKATPRTRPPTPENPHLTH